MKKAQMKMGENIAVLLVFFMIFGISILFYGAYKVGDVQKTQLEFFEKESIRIALAATYLPELACTDDNHIIDNCFDIIKVEKVADLMISTDEYYLLYQDEFRYSRISFDIIFPSSELEGGIVVYDNPPANFTDRIPTFIPVSIKDPRKDFGKQYSFGILKVEVYR